MSVRHDRNTRERQGRVQPPRLDEAIEAFTAADREGALSPEDLELVSTAQWWSGHPDEATEGLERTFTAYSDAGRRPEAAWVAMTLAYQAFQRVNGPVGGGWLARAERLLADEPESKMHARLGVFHAFGALMAGQVEQGIVIADSAMEIARRHDDVNALYMAMSFAPGVKVQRDPTT